MNVAITGASGFIGRNLASRLAIEGHAVRAISTRNRIDPASLAGCNSIVHLAGEPVAQRWTAAAKQRIRESRVEGTRRLVDAIAAMAQKPTVLVSASAIGFYGSRGDAILTEGSPPAPDFLGLLSVAWEAEAAQAESFDVRVVNPRIGVVLGLGGGALKAMLPAYRLGAGGKIGSGRQWMSWIHVDDLVALIVFALTDQRLRGPVNATAPNPVTNADFTRALARALRRPAILPVPGFALKLAMGEMSSMLLGGQRVIPRVALDAGFKFRYSELDSALAALFGSHSTSGTPSM